MKKEFEETPTVCYSADRSFIWETLNFPDKILCIDTETSGLDPNINSIIELGMVWLYKDKIVPVFHSLFRIDEPLPDEVIALTGIDNEELSLYAPISESIVQISEICSEVEAFLGHNLAFDLSFLSSEFKRCNQYFSIPNQLFDTRSLARMLYPEAPPGGLSGWSRWFQIQHTPHRALSDALVTAQLFYKCLDRLHLLSQEDCDLLAMLSDFSKYGFQSLHWNRLKTIVPKKEKRVLPIPPWSSSNKTSVAQNVEIPVNIDFTLRENGWIHEKLPNFVERKAQIEYAHTIKNALHSKTWAIVEAGTGIGKTFGYLAPIMEWLAEDESRRIIISTFSKTLQEQLFHKDIPIWLDLVSNSTATLLKGRSNYICPYRFDIVINKRMKFLTSLDAMQTSALVLWLNWTTTGDLNEIVPFNESKSFFRNIIADPFVCKTRDCPNGEVDCFFGRQRQMATTSRIVVVNHSLLCYTILHQPNLLGNFNAIIIDEGHRFEEVARDTLTVELSQNIIRQIREFWNEATTSLPDDEYNLLKEFVNHLLSIEESWVRFLSKIKERVLEVEENEFGRRYRYSEGGPFLWNEQFAVAFENVLKTAVEEVNQLTLRLTDKFQSLLVLDGIKNRLADLFLTWNRIKLANEGYTSWFELAPQSEYENIQFFSAPIDVGNILKEILFGEHYFGAITSATLSINGDFQFFEKSIGLDTNQSVTKCSFPAPFDLDKQLKIIVPMFGPDPWSTKNFQMEVLNDWLIPALEYARVNTLVLSTAKRIGTAIAKNWKLIFAQKNIPVWLQGIDGSPAELIEHFRIHRPSILIGYDSFWEGVDLPGSSLECIIIPRLPFPVPDDPIYSAKADLCKKENLSDFWNLSIPQVILKIKQGIGRMIRKETDFGLVIILDRRLFTSNYGYKIIESLPVRVDSVKSEQEFATYFTWISKKTNENLRN